MNNQLLIKDETKKIADLVAVKLTTRELVDLREAIQSAINNSHQFNQHAGDCTIYRSIINNRPYDGICTCGYGWQEARKVSILERNEMLLVSEEKRNSL